ncbi:MAG: tetratricopeptide repeat protein [Anaerolineaceae bacterium]|nr:tetratricopeptide repeat protein [Anaerolineaceae bacterium]
MQDNLYLVDRLIEQRDVKKAETLIAKGLRATMQKSDHVELLIRRARVRLLTARPDDALMDLSTVQADDETRYRSFDVQELVADSYLARFEQASVGFVERQDTIKAQGIYQAILDESSNYNNTGWIHYQVGRVQLTAGDTEAAAQSFQAALLTPSHVRNLTAYCYERLGFIALYEWRAPNKALTFLNKSVDTYPASEDQSWLIQVHNLRSRALREMQDFHAALLAAREAVEIATTSGVEGRKGLSEALLTSAEILSIMDGHEKETAHYLQRFLRITKKPLGVDVTWSRVYEMLGSAYFRLGQYQDALVSYQSALQFNPDHPWEISLRYQIACCYYQQRSYESVVSELEGLVETLEITDYRIYDVIGNARFALGHYDEALEMYQVALRLVPSNADDKDKIQKYYGFAQHLSTNSNLKPSHSINQGQSS